MMNSGVGRFCSKCSSLVFSRASWGISRPIPAIKFSTGMSTQMSYQNANNNEGVGLGTDVTQLEPQRKKRKEILKMPESELEGYAIGVKKAPLIDRTGEGQSIYARFVDNDSKSNPVDLLSFIQSEIDLRPKTIKRWWRSLEAQLEISEQVYIEQRHNVLGNDLAAAHFIVFRKGKVRFKGHPEWIARYRTDSVTGNEDELDLPVMTFEKCTLPTRYDPRFRLEAIDASNMNLLYEGLANLENLEYVKWISLRNCPNIDDWCMDKLLRIFSKKLEYLDISGCANITDRSVGAIRRCTNLKTLVVEDMAHIPDLFIVCAQLEDEISGLTVLGVDYAMKLVQLRQQNEENERRELEIAAEVEANTITIESSNPEENNEQNLLSSEPEENRRAVQSKE